MRKLLSVLVVLGLLYTVGTLLLLMYEDALYNQLNLLDMIEYSKIWMILGLVLLVGFIVLGSMYVRSLTKQHQRLGGEYLALKARLYDMENSRRAEDEEAGKRIEAFRQSLDRGNRPGDTTPPQL